MKILTVLGARPQFIKAGSVSRAIAKKNKSGFSIDEVIVHTGQHYDKNMSDVFFSEMGIPAPNYNLDINGVSHGKMTGRMIEQLEEIITCEMPDWVLVYGDTNTTLAAALAASKLNVKIAHIEAGLRSYNNKMPEEINRILTDRVSTLLFCPTKAAIDNLESEGLSNWKNDSCAILSGDVMYDGVCYYREMAIKPTSLTITRKFVLCTIHRAENTDDKARMIAIIRALQEVAINFEVVLPLHPRTKKIIESYGISMAGLHVIDPVGYFNMIWLLENCQFVLTDSGGLQKEAYFFSKYCITLRDETEWIELIDIGVNVLVGSDRNEIVAAAESALTKDVVYGNLYGDGKSSELIVNILAEH